MADVMAAFQRHKDRVYRLALSYTGSAAEAEDVCQTAFLRLLEREAQVPEEKVKSWLMTVTVNLCKDVLRSAWFRGTQTLNEDIAFHTPEQGEVFYAMMALKPKERVPVYLYYYEGYTTAEIGRLLHISQSAVTTRLSRARKHMKRILEEEWT